MRYGSGKFAGRYVTSKGYLRISAGEHRGRFEHSIVMLELCREFCFYPLQPNGLPSNFSVEHVDHNKQHNCISNLLLLQNEIHNQCSWRSMRSLDDFKPSISNQYTTAELLEVPF